MTSPVLVFSADVLRGRIIEKVLNRSGFECLIFNRILETREDIVRHAPAAVIVDTENCISEEINHLRNICHMLKHDAVIVLGKEPTLDGFKWPRFRKGLCLSDPLDPELIAAKIKDIASRKKSKGDRTESDMLENTLKQLLHLN